MALYGRLLSVCDIALPLIALLPHRKTLERSWPSPSLSPLMSLSSNLPGWALSGQVACPHLLSCVSLRAVTRAPACPEGSCKVQPNLPACPEGQVPFPFRNFFFAPYCFQSPNGETEAGEGKPCVDNRGRGSLILGLGTVPGLLLFADP